MVVAGSSSETSVTVTTQNGVIFQKILNFSYMELKFYKKNATLEGILFELVESVLIV
jgi:hypothetical protein